MRCVAKREVIHPFDGRANVEATFRLQPVPGLAPKPPSNLKDPDSWEGQLILPSFGKLAMGSIPCCQRRIPRKISNLNCFNKFPESLLVMHGDVQGRIL